MKPFVILGASKTGTSTAVAAANAHPLVFCLFESDFSGDGARARNRDLIALLPPASALFGAGQTFSECLTRIHTLLKAKGWPFEQIGTKVQGIRPDIIPQLGDAPVLFMVRDIRLWAVKNRVLRDVIGADKETNVVPFLVEYARYFLDSFLIERCIRLPFDRVLSTNLSILPQALEKTLGLPQMGFEEWWLRAPAWKRTAPKNYSDWIEGHTTAFLPPLLTDTQSRLALHPFWNNFLPIFDKYFLDPDKSYARHEVLRDQQALDELARTHTMRLEEGFTQFNSFKIRRVSNGADGKVVVEGTDRVTHADIDQAIKRWQQFRRPRPT